MSETIDLRIRYRDPVGPATVLMLMLWLSFTSISYLFGGFSDILPDTYAQFARFSFVGALALIAGLTVWVLAFVRYDRNRRRILLIPTLAAMVYPVWLLGGMISQNLSSIPFIQ